MKNISKWSQTIKIAWAKHTAYRLNFFLQIIGPALVFFFIKYNLWSAIYQDNNETIIQGYKFQDMIQYHIWALVVGLIAQGHSAIDMAIEIRHGKISTYLIYPFNFWEFHTASFFAFQFLQTIVAIATICFLLFFGILPTINIEIVMLGFLYCFFVSLFWFALQYFTGLLAFWLEETWMIRVMLQVIAVFLSGAIIPLDFFPEQLVSLLDYTPFPFLSYYPVQMLMGNFSFKLQPFLIMGGWLVIICFFNHLLWKKGVKHYTAAGM